MYHKECLLAWLNVKLECPQCRSALPKPYDYDGAAVSLYSDEDDDPNEDNRLVAISQQRCNQIPAAQDQENRERISDLEHQ